MTGMVIGHLAFPPADAAYALTSRSAQQHGASPAERTELDALRTEAVGSAFLTRWVGAALMDRFDRSGDTDDLYEALVWVDRSWALFADTELTARFAKGYCEERIVQWHWICNAGE